MHIHGRLYVGTPLALLAGSLCLVRQGIAQDALHGWRTEAATSAIALVAVEQSKATTTFVLKNTSAKPILAFAVEHDGIGHRGVGHESAE